MKRFFALARFKAGIVTALAIMAVHRLLTPVPSGERHTLKLVLASRDLELGTILQERDVVLTDWPGAVPLSSATKTQDLVGRGVVSKIFAKEPILETRLAPKERAAGSP